MTRDPEKWWKSMHMILGHVMDKFSTVLVQIQPGLRWMPQLVAEYESTTAQLLESVGKKPGDYGPCPSYSHTSKRQRLTGYQGL